MGIEIRRIGKTDPFLTVVTRCYKRPNMLKVNQKSLQTQSDPDYEQLLLIDRVGVGVPTANTFFYMCKDLPNGQFVFILDDDNALTHDDFIKELKDIAGKHNPDAVVFRIKWPNMRFCPVEPNNWKQRPVRGRIDGCCYVVRTSVWKEHIAVWGQPKKGEKILGGDYRFIAEVWDAGHTFFWWQKIVGRIQRVSRGRVE